MNINSNKSSLNNSTPSRTTGHTPGHSSQQSESQQFFISIFTEMNDKAIESMGKDEPETALEYLKKADETLAKLNNEQ